VHANCALWSDWVYDNSEGMILNFYFAYDDARYIKCSYCGLLGASITCQSKICGTENHSNLKWVYHMPCALKDNCHFYGKFFY